MAWITAPSSGLEVGLHSPAMTNFPIPVLRLVEVIPVPVRDNCCGHIISDTPENESNNRNFEGNTPVLCSSRLTNTVGKVSGLHIELVFWRKRLMDVLLSIILQLNPVQFKISWWITCLRQYMKAILFQKKSSERTSSLKWNIDMNPQLSLSLSPKSHQRSHPVSVQPVTTHSRSYEICKRGQEDEKAKETNLPTAKV